MNPTGTEARVCADIAARQAKGTAKYGTTVQDNPLGLIQWLQHAYEECLDQAVYLKRVMELMQGVEGHKPFSNDEIEKLFGKAEIAARLKRFETADTISAIQGMQEIKLPANPGVGDKVKVVGPAVVSSEYGSADPHAELKAIYQPGMRWKVRCPESGFKNWSDWSKDHLGVFPAWNGHCQYEIHPDDLPKPQPKEDGWIAVPDDCMEMPEGLKADDRVEVMSSNGNTHRGLSAGSWDWRPSTDFRIVAYRPHHQTR